VCVCVCVFVCEWDNTGSCIKCVAKYSDLI